MTYRIRIAALALVGLAVGAPASGQLREEGWERYLDGYRGPYRARVVDADTKAPLVGAVVVAYWSRNRILPFHSVNEAYAVRETVTDADGRFELSAKDVEENAPRRTRRPEFRIFTPGYGAFPGFQRAPRGFTGGIFEKPDTVVELPRLESKQQRLENHHAADPYNFSERPFRELPRLMRAFNEERLAIGLDPLPDPEKQP
jgi:hypothetical protein